MHLPFGTLDQESHPPQKRAGIISIMTTMQEILAAHKELADKLRELELKMETHDEQITAIFEAINQLLAPPPVIKKKIGFQVKEKKVLYKKV